MATDPPREIRETERIVRNLTRWATALGIECEACRALATRVMARRNDTPGTDQDTLAALYERAQDLELSLLEQAAAVRGAGLAGLATRYALFAELVAPDQRIAERLQDLELERPDNPRDHEDWCAQLKEANSAFLARVKRSETELIARLDLYLGECARRLESAGALPRLAARDARLAALRATFDTFNAAGLGGDALSLLADVERARALAADLAALETAIRHDRDRLAEQRADLQRRAAWLAERAEALGIALPTAPPILAEPTGSGDRQTDPERERCELEQVARVLAESEAQFARLCAAELDSGQRRIAQIAAALSSERTGSGAPDLAPPPESRPTGLDAIAAGLARIRARLAATAEPLAAEEQALADQAAGHRRSLGAISPEQLSHHDRNERERTLNDLESWHPEGLADPLGRIAALRERIDNAGQVIARLETAARRIQERRESLHERLRRFNGLSLQDYCPELYLRVESLAHPPSQTRWPGDGEALQLQEAERLLGLLERQCQRLAAREVAEQLEVLQRHALREKDPQARSIMDEIAALPSGQPPSAALRQRLAELAEARAILAPHQAPKGRDIPAQGDALG
jgi:hypothetical protein